MLIVVFFVVVADEVDDVVDYVVDDIVDNEEDVVVIVVVVVVFVVAIHRCRNPSIDNTNLIESAAIETEQLPIIVRREFGSRPLSERLEEERRADDGDGRHRHRCRRHPRLQVQAQGHEGAGSHGNADQVVNRGEEKV